MNDKSERARILIAGGGIAGLEALLALHDLAGDRVEMTLLAPQQDFVYRPMIVDEPFSRVPAERHELAPIAEGCDAVFVEGALTELRPQDHIAVISGDRELEYDAAVICVGAKSSPAFPKATTLLSWSDPIEIDAAIDAAASVESRTLVFVVPTSVTWALPLYELAMLSHRRALERGLAVNTLIVTPEERPLGIFGTTAAEAVSDLLRGLGIGVLTSTHAARSDGTSLVLEPGGETLAAGAVVALPVLSGPRVAGLPSDADGFIPIDEHCAVRGVEDVYAAGDGTTFPIKQGGIGTQQADAIAETIAKSVGARVEPKPFRPILRGKLITGPSTVNLANPVVGGGGEGTASLDYLWWPPGKVAGRYLAPFLAGTSGFDPEPPARAIDVEVSVPHEWHSRPLTPGLS